ncbi:MAG: HDIG domain-containing metalloprotein [Patescibacteria group bacterium]
MKPGNKNSDKFNALLEKEGILNLAKKIAHKFKDAEVYAVGGAVRDIILGRPVKDLDILIRKVRFSDLEKFLKTKGKVDAVGKRFSVLKFLGKGLKKQLDIAIPRLDFSFGTGGYKDVKTKSDPNLPIEEDLARRDFSINAMAWNILEERLADPFGGIADLKAKLIKTVGAPKERFGEDYSRMLRAIRFAIQLDFKIEDKTWNGIKKYISHINDMTEGGERKVPYEVISAEFLKSFSASPSGTIEKYLDCGAIKKLMPEILKMKGCSQPPEFHGEGDVLTHTLLALDNLDSKIFKKYFSSDPDLTTKVAILFHDIGKPSAKKKLDGRVVFHNHDKEGAKIARNILERMKMSAPPEIGIDTGKIEWLIENHLVFLHSHPRDMKKTTLEKYFFGRYGGESLLQLFLADAWATKPEGKDVDLERFKVAYKLWKEMRGTKKEAPPKPLINGDGIMKILKIPSGPKVGQVLELLREEQLTGRIKTKKEAENFLKKLTL